MYTNSFIGSFEYTTIASRIYEKFANRYVYVSWKNTGGVISNYLIELV